MSNENENIPGSSKDGYNGRNGSSNGGDKKNENREPLRNGKNIIDENENNSQEDLLSNRQTSRIRKVEAFIYMQIPPDGGYAWVVLVTSFFSVLIVDGMRLTIGRILPYISADLGISKKEEALIASLQIAIFNFCAPFACALMHKIGYRAVGMIGACMIIFGTIVGSFTTSPINLMIYFGMICGCGFGMVSLATQIIIGFYFEKYRAIAAGISSSGSGFGLLIFSPLDNFIAFNYGWQIALRWHAFLGVVILILCISFREVQPTKIGHYFKENVEEESYSYEHDNSTVSFEISMYNFQNSDIHSQSSVQPKIKLNEPIPQKQNATQKSNSKMENNTKPPKNKCRTFLSSKCCTLKQKESEISANRRIDDIHIEINPLDRQDIFYQGKPDYKINEDKFDDKFILLPQSVDKVRSVHYTKSVIINLRKDKEEMDKKTLCEFFFKIISVLKVLVDPALLRNREFQYILASTFLYTLGTNVPYLYFTELVEIPEIYANYLLSALGLSNLLFRIFGGFLAFSTTINPIYIAGIPMAIGGIFTTLSGFVFTNIIWYQFFYCIILGIGFALPASLRSIILVKLLGLDKLTNAIGLNSLTMGIASFMGTNIAGIIISYTGQIKYTFVYAGITLILGGCVLVISANINHIYNGEEKVSN